MKLYLIGHNCKYAVEQMLLTLYPNERPEYPEGAPRGDCAIISFFRGRSLATAKCILTLDGKVYRGSAAATAAETEHNKVLNKTWQSEFNIAGSNRVAQKRNVVERVKEYFNIDVTDDVGDAILIGRYAADTLYERWTNKIF